MPQAPEVEEDNRPTLAGWEVCNRGPNPVGEVCFGGRLRWIDPPVQMAGPAQAPCIVSNDHSRRERCRNHCRQMLSTMPASQAPNRSGSRKLSNDVSAMTAASWTASSTRTWSPSIRCASIASIGR